MPRHRRSRLDEMRPPLRGLATLSEHLDTSAGGGGADVRTEGEQAGDPSATGRRQTDGAAEVSPAAGCWAASSSPPWPWCWWGFFQIVEASALFQKELHLNYPDLLFPFDLTVWGVVHLVIGVLLIAAGLAVRTARPWARSVGIAFAMISAVANFLFAVYSPAWSVTVIALDVVVIWALCASQLGGHTSLTDPSGHETRSAPYGGGARRMVKPRGRRAQGRGLACEDRRGFVHARATPSSAGSTDRIMR